jgi:hypothetical protein
VPSIADFVPGFETSTWVGIGAPRNTPATIIDRLNIDTQADRMNHMQGRDPQAHNRLSDTIRAKLGTEELYHSIEYLVEGSGDNRKLYIEGIVDGRGASCNAAWTRASNRELAAKEPGD